MVGVDLAVFADVWFMSLVGEHNLRRGEKKHQDHPIAVEVQSEKFDCEEQPAKRRSTKDIPAFLHPRFGKSIRTDVASVLEFGGYLFPLGRIAFGGLHRIAV